MHTLNSFLSSAYEPSLELKTRGTNTSYGKVLPFDKVYTGGDSMWWVLEARHPSNQIEKLLKNSSVPHPPTCSSQKPDVSMAPKPPRSHGHSVHSDPPKSSHCLLPHCPGFHLASIILHPTSPSHTAHFCSVSKVNFLKLAMVEPERGSRVSECQEGCHLSTSINWAL
jgi:hypothetical protein